MNGIRRLNEISSNRLTQFDCGGKIDKSQHTIDVKLTSIERRNPKSKPIRNEKNKELTAEMNRQVKKEETDEQY